MGKEKQYVSNCPSCGVEKTGRDRDAGKLCKSCNMKSVEKEHRHKRIKENKPTAAEHHRNYRTKYKLDDKHRLSRLLQQARVRAKQRGFECSLTLDDLIKMFPADRKCPALGLDLMWGTNGKGNRNNSPSLDRIDSSLGYTKDNVCIISWKANRIKSNATPDELEAILYYMKA
jgi:hypothetical protein